MYKRRPDSKYYCYDFEFAGRRYRGSTKQTTSYMARLKEGKLREELRTDGLISKRSPLLSAFSVKFLQWVDEEQTIAAKTKDSYRHG